MKLLVAGGGGQLGRALARRAALHGHPVDAPARADLDVTDTAAITRWLERAAPDVVVNAAAYTAVDRAEREPDAAFAANATGPAALAAACATAGVRMIHVSTDYVFSGESPRPYREDDPVAPLGVYGRSKAEGEVAVLAASPSAIVVRTARVFSGDGASFVRSIVRLALAQPTLRVVDDQIGCPTPADDLADALIALAARAVRGGPGLATRYHACGDGPISWCGFARAIVDEARRHRALACEGVVAVTTAEYPTPARRPAYAVLDTARLAALEIAPRSWRPGLAAAVGELLAPGAAPP